VSERPLRFEEIVGQSQAIRIFDEALRRGRLPQVYLFVGPEGVGKETTAKALFFKLVCKEGLGCGHCPGCRKFIRGVHPDVEYLEPQGKSLKIEQIRALEAKLRFVPLEAERRLILIPQAEALTREAANALLKSLEEPPPYTLFVLLAVSTDVLLPTIVSRSQVIRFRPLPSQLISQVLVERFEKSPEEAEGLAILAEGSLGRALRLAEQGFLEELSRLAIAIESKDPARLLALAEVLAGLKDNLIFFLELTLVWLRQSLRAGLGLEEYPRSFPPLIPQSAVLPAMSLVEETIRSLERNINRELAMLALLIRLQELVRRAKDAEITTEGASAA